MMPWALLTAELTVSGWILLLLGADLIVPAARKARLWLVALAGIAVTWGVLQLVEVPPAGATFQRMFLLDPFAAYFKTLFLLTAAVVVLMTREFRPLAERAGSFYLLLFTAVLGALVLASVNDLLMLFIGLELLTFSLYVMAAYLKTEARSVEAGMKYLVLGSISSGFLVYGIALLYGAAGSTGFDAVRGALLRTATMPSVAAGVLLILAGLGFKIAALPFNFWVPDVYEGAPTPVVAFLSVGSKMAGVVAILRVLYGAFAPLQHIWGEVLALMAAGTMCYGNLAAIPQTNIKRLLGYSSIGHAGYLLMGLATGSAAGAQAVAYYLLAYLVSTLAVFLVVVVASDAVGGDELDRYDGLSKRSPVLAAGLFVGMLSLAGVPPLAGFVGKLFVLLAATDSGLIWLVAIGAVNVAISLYYYLMVVRRMYLLAPRAPDPIRVSGITRTTLFLLLAAIVVIGVVQEPFLVRITDAIRP